MLAIVGTNGQVLYFRHAEPGSRSERVLSRLAARHRMTLGDTGVPAKPD
jgi:hypothetical protein